MSASDRLTSHDDRSDRFGLNGIEFASTWLKEKEN
jgi:hypothetical protein